MRGDHRPSSTAAKNAPKWRISGKGARPDAQSRPDLYQTPGFHREQFETSSSPLAGTTPFPRPLAAVFSGTTPFPEAIVRTFSGATSFPETIAVIFSGPSSVDRQERRSTGIRAPARPAERRAFLAPAPPAKPERRTFLVPASPPEPRGRTFLVPAPPPRLRPPQTDTAAARARLASLGLRCSYNFSRDWMTSAACSATMIFWSDGNENSARCARTRLK